MLTRQKIILALLSEAKKPLGPTVFVKLMFLLRHETPLKEENTFYDFVPYKYGPFSFALYRELGSLRLKGFVAREEDRVALCEKSVDTARAKIRELPNPVHQAVAMVLARYKKLSQASLIKDIYKRYPWFAINSEIADSQGLSAESKPCAPIAVYTAGYEGKSIDMFFDYLLQQGIKTIVDVRFNPGSRKYGFSKKHFREIAKKLGIDYHHSPSLDIPSNDRTELTDFASYQRLLNRYEKEMLPTRKADIAMVSQLMQKRPSVLVCMEKDIRLCHRGRLAKFVSLDSKLKTVHL